MSKVISIVSLKGGAGKTSAAISIAGYLAKHHSTLLIDSDPNLSALSWHQRGDGMGFDCCSVASAPMKMTSSNYGAIVIDSQARPTQDDLNSLTDSDLVILASTPEPMGIEALVKLVGLMPSDCNYRALVGISPPKPQKDGAIAISALTDAGIPCFEKPIRRLKEYVRASEQGRLPKGMGLADWKPVFKEIDRLWD